MALTGKIIQSVKMRPALYDPRHEEFRNTRLKDELWQEIGSKLNRNGQELKKKWKNIKDTYGKHLKCSKMKVVQTRKNYKHWQWAQEMEYFRPYLACSKSTIDDDGMETDDDENDELMDNNLVSDVNGVELVEVTPLTNMADYEYESSTDATDYTTVGKLNRNEVCHKTKVEPVDRIFQGYAQMVKTFSVERQAYIKLKIAELMSVQEVEHHKEQQAANSDVNNANLQLKMEEGKPES
ncbi:MADF [Nesidiocoris tenuis]|uniref:MADF n=1 Tax=Nesidiocoris tenuis TaxID=355587 RepID=A0ABN7BAS8_9HEMI|nr:MADF [Nesidiocoris tenuis]